MGERGKNDQSWCSGQSGRRFTLPSGQMVEVIRPQAQVERWLHLCRQCGSELVQPIEWGDTDAEGWELALECPNCRWSHHGLFGDEQLSELEDHLDNGFDELLRDLKRLTAANMAEEIERFAVALEAGLILPEDF